MWVQSLCLVNFRNYVLLKINFQQKVNILFGGNAQGKTNLLESLSFLASGRSFRTRSDAETVLWGQTTGVAEGKVVHSMGENCLKVSVDLHEKEKKYLTDGVFCSRQEYLGRLTTVLFTPEDLLLAKGGPQVRRRFLDEEIGKVSPLYEAELLRYQHLLKQRNHLLRISGKKFVTSAELESWDEQLAKIAAIILRKRRAAVYRISLLARLAHRRLTGRKESLEISYLSTVPFGDKDDEEKLAEAMLAGLAAKRGQELRFGLTLVGPHRDDLRIVLNNRDARHFASQGQQRTLVLALKLAELEYVKGETGEFPVLLFDDVFSELDESRRQFLMETVDGRAQTFITGTEVEKFRDLKKYGATFQVCQGEVRALD